MVDNHKSVTCPHCGTVNFRIGAKRCIQCGEVLRLNPVLVEYKPDGQRANQMIQHLNGMVPTMNPQEFAGFLASTVAAAAYMMLEMNSPATIKEVFGALIDDAAKQRKNRTKKAAN